MQLLHVEVTCVYGAGPSGPGSGPGGPVGPEFCGSCRQVVSLEQAVVIVKDGIEGQRLTLSTTIRLE